MKLLLHFKTPDAVELASRDAYESLSRQDVLEAIGWRRDAELIPEGDDYLLVAFKRCVSRCLSKWITQGENLCVEFDIEQGIARVKEWNDEA